MRGRIAVAAPVVVTLALGAVVTTMIVLWVGSVSDSMERQRERDRQDFILLMDRLGPDNMARVLEAGR